MRNYNINYKNSNDLDNFLSIENTIVNEKNILIQIFSGILDSEYLEELTKLILDRIPQAKIIGSTTDGEIFEGEVYLHSTILSISIFENTTIDIACVSHKNQKCESFDSGRLLAEQLIKNNTKVLISFADGLCFNGQEFLEGLTHNNKDITVAGGLSGDNGKFEKTLLVCQDKVFSGGSVCVALNNDNLQVYTDYSFAWQQIGKKFIVRRAIRSRVYDIDGMTPVELYRKYLGDEVADSLPNIGIEFPLIILDDNDIPIARAVLNKYNDGSLSFAGTIPEGAQVRFGIGNIENLVQDGIKCSTRLSQNLPQSVFVYSCMARRRFLDSRPCADIKHISQLINNNGFLPMVSFFLKKEIHSFLMKL